MRHRLIAYQIIAHLSVVLALWQFSLWGVLASLFVYFVIITLGVSAGYHRLFSHKSYEAPRWFKITSLLIASLGLNASALVWTCMHREHHAYSDHPRDPHSPSILGFWHSYFDVIRYQPNPRFGKDVLRDKDVMFFHKHYFTINLTYDMVLFLINPMLVVWLHLIPAMILWHATAWINTFSHLDWVGYRNYDTDDHSRNSTFLSVFVVGEGYHNNHHHDPKVVDFAHRPGEFDFTAMIINLIRTDKPSDAVSSL